MKIVFAFTFLLISSAFCHGNMSPCCNQVLNLSACCNQSSSSMMNSSSMMTSSGPNFAKFKNSTPYVNFSKSGSIYSLNKAKNYVSYFIIFLN